jgi:hypothetical protein
MAVREYPSKVIIAWAEAIDGNVAIRDWLMANGYPELGLFVFALHLKKDARQWLMDNGFPHLMATIECTEGREQACQWLQKYDLILLEKVARAADNDEHSAQWLMDRNFQDMLRLAVRIRKLKNEIQSRHDDMHFISPE